MATRQRSRPRLGSPVDEPMEVKNDDEEETLRLKSWVSDFNARMERKEAEKERVYTQQSIQAGIEMTAVLERRAAEEQRRVLEEQRLEEERLAAEAKAKAEEAEEDRIQSMTANMTEEERARWIEDDLELREIEAKMNRIHDGMAQRGSVINKLLDEYDEKLRKQAAAEQAAKEEEQRALDDFAAEQRAERQLFEDQLVAERTETIEALELEERAAMHQMYSQEGEVALRFAREALYRRLPEEVRTHVDSLGSEEEKNAFYDEVMQMEVLNAELDRLVGKKDRSAKTATENSSPVVGSSPSSPPQQTSPKKVEEEELSKEEKDELTNSFPQKGNAMNVLKMAQRRAKSKKQGDTASPPASPAKSSDPPPHGTGSDEGTVAAAASTNAADRQ